MKIRVTSATLLLLLGLAMALPALASDVKADQHIQMVPKLESVSAVQKNFPAPTAVMCFGGGCQNASGMAQKFARDQPFGMKVQVSASTCKNYRGYFQPVPYDIDGNCQSDLLWMNDQTHQFGWWLIQPINFLNTDVLTHTVSNLVTITPGYWVAASGDFNGDGKADLVWTSNNRDLYLWTSNGNGFSSSYIATYPAGWKLVGSADINGDGSDDLIWENDSACEFGYWLMSGNKIIASKTISVSCGFQIHFVETAYDSATGTTPAIYWTNISNPSYPIDALYRWLPVNQTLNAASMWYQNGTFAAGSYTYGGGAGLSEPTLFYEVSQNGINFIYFCSELNCSGVSTAAGPGAGYQVVSAGHYVGINGNEDIVWAGSDNSLKVWSMNPSPSGLDFTAFSLGTFPAGWHIVRPGAQN